MQTVAATNTANTTKSTRRQALRAIGLLGGAFMVTRTLAACGFDTRGGNEAVGSSEDGLVSCDPPVISSNHGHALSVSPEDIAAGEEKTYSIKGSSSHPHTVVITAQHFALLAAGGAITVVSSTDAGHKHNVTVTCSAVTKPDAGGDGDASDPDGSTSGEGGDAGVDGSQPPQACASGASATSISANHGHALVVPAADVASGVAKTYSIKGTSSHPHDVALTAAHFAELEAGRSITILSSNVGGHTHSVTVSCA